VDVPGQASQYPNMLKDIYESYPQVAALYMQADAYWKSKYGDKISSFVFGDDEEHLQTVLKDTMLRQLLKAGKCLCVMCRRRVLGQGHGNRLMC